MHCSVNEMLQTAKLFARRGSSLEPNTSGSSKRVNGLTFGEFCVLAADLKRFRTNGGRSTDEGEVTTPATSSRTNSNHDDSTTCRTGNQSNGNRVTLTKTIAIDADVQRPLAPTRSLDDVDEEAPELPEVFLGGSCNPTTWRADVAIPALDKFGITFYNPVGFIKTKFKKMFFK